MSKLLIEFAHVKDTQNTIHINQALQEQRFKYTCIDCGEELLIRDGEINRKHFSHRSDSECKMNTERHFRINSICWYHLIRGNSILKLDTRTLKIKDVESNANIGSMTAPILVKTYTGKDIILSPHKTKGYTQQMKYFAHERGLEFYEIFSTTKGTFFIFTPVYKLGDEYTKGFKKEYEKYKAKVTRLQQLKGEK